MFFDILTVYRKRFAITMYLLRRGHIASYIRCAVLKVVRSHFGGNSLGAEEHNLKFLEFLETEFN